MDPPVPDPSVPRVSFESNLDELADAYVQYVLSTPAGQSMRRRATAGIGCAGGLLGFAPILMDPASRRPDLIFAAGILALLAGGSAAVLNYMLYRSSARRRLRRFLAIQFGQGAFRCEIELRPEGAWARQEHVEVKFGWNDLLAAEDFPDGVELRFRGGYLLARARAFASTADRAEFLESARVLGARAQMDARDARRARATALAAAEQAVDDWSQALTLDASASGRTRPTSVAGPRDAACV